MKKTGGINNIKYNDLRLLGTVNRARYTQIATKHINDITKDIHEKLGENRQAYHVMTEGKWSTEDVRLEHKYAEDRMNKVIHEARIREDPRAVEQEALIGRFNELRIQDQYEAN